MSSPRSWLAGLLLAVPLAPALSAGAPGPCASQEDPASSPEPVFELASFSKQLREVGRWKGNREEALYEDLMASLAASGAPQFALVQDALRSAPADIGSLPEPLWRPAFDPEEYPPGKARKGVKASSSKWKKLAESLADEEATRELPQRFRYDFATGQVQLLDPDLPKARRLTEALEFALMGFPPDQDLAEALLIQRMDRGRPQAQLAEFFEHTYADLDSKAYEGITLYDVWAHQIPLDVPDVDLRAFADRVHGVTLPAKLNDTQRREWYERMSAGLTTLRDHRSGATAVPAYWLQAAPRLPGGWTIPRNSLQSLAATMEDVDAWVAAYEEHGDRIAEHALGLAKESGDEFWDLGNERREQLLAGRLAIRAAAAAALERALD